MALVDDTQAFRTGCPAQAVDVEGSAEKVTVV